MTWSDRSISARVDGGDGLRLAPPLYRWRLLNEKSEVSKVVAFALPLTSLRG